MVRLPFVMPSTHQSWDPRSYFAFEHNPRVPRETQTGDFWRVLVELSSPIELTCLTRLRILFGLQCFRDHLLLRSCTTNLVDS